MAAQTTRVYVASPGLLVYAAAVSVSPGFSMDIVAAPGDIDALGHVSNLVYVRWVQDVAQAHSVAVGYDVERYRALGAVFVVRRHEIDYLRPAYAGDRIRLGTWIESWKAATSVRMTTVTRLAREQGDPEEPVELARARTLWALVSVDAGRPRRIPEELRAAFMERAFPAPG